MNRRSTNRTTTPLQWTVVLPLLALSGYYLFNSLQRVYAPPKWHSDVSAVGHRSGTIHREGGRQFLWAQGPKDPEDPASKWFDLTGAPLPLEEFQFGIGKDTIPAIDNPVFVRADDPRFAARFGRSEDGGVDHVRVIGFVHNGDARAYPLKLLNRHELVNDTVGGKPVTVGW